jgi:hypothetical protein
VVADGKPVPAVGNGHGHPRERCHDDSDLVWDVTVQFDHGVRHHSRQAFVQ